MIAVVQPGLLTTIQDAGRHGWAHLGVPPAGPVDPVSHARANLLVGNDVGTAALEITLAGPELRTDAPLTIALVGGQADVTIDGQPAAMDAALAVPAGSTVTVGRLRSGLRCYLAVAGGLDVEPVLGSRSTDTLSGLGPPQLAAGHRLAVGQPAATGVRPVPPPPAAREAEQPVRVIAGPDDDWFTRPALAALTAGVYTVTPAGDRTGVRLDGPPLERADPGRELPPAAMVTGAVQVPPDGRPVILLANRQSTGGYPVIAVVATVDLPAVAQARPGAQLRFRTVDVDEAVEALQSEQAFR